MRNIGQTNKITESTTPIPSKKKLLASQLVTPSTVVKMKGKKLHDSMLKRPSLNEKLNNNFYKSSNHSNSLSNLA